MDNDAEFLGHGWIADNYARDLEDVARCIRKEAESHANFLEGKADLLREQMAAAQAMTARFMRPNNGREGTDGQRT